MTKLEADSGLRCLLLAIQKSEVTNRNHFWVDPSRFRLSCTVVTRFRI
jgi:hypothetical protein